MKARILVLSHSYIMRSYRRKFTLIGDLTAKYPEVQIRIITPSQWIENFQQLTFTPTPDNHCQEFSLPIYFSGYGSRFVYRRGLTTHFRDFQPDIIHLEEEAWSLNALQIIRFKNKYCPQSRFIFRTSLSVDIKQRFGFFPMWIEKKVFNHTDMAFPLSENGVNILRRRGYTKEVTVFPNGVDLR
ncbi:MAG: glycosyltransferase, partial [Candidatus Poribacteria bacterium]|nr:glycosyltransferase [Candidatus Poribacteria bacterium]